ncbi:MAG TPA: RNA 2',3'-cyclic phosphodiesterase [Vitreimonas sp.]|jgi:2'-5' RNA ligase|nr:RNA 2',3'-cyclic phosphodiesterase [Vitreimonas sp.]
MTIRLFAALAIPDDVAERLLALQKGVGGAKWRPRENLHLTLRFFGEIAEPVANDVAEELADLADRTKPFELQLKSAGWFGKEDPHALWIGAAETPALKKLAADCERAARRAGLAPEPRKFSPHVTLAYLNNADLGRVKDFGARLGLFESRPFEVESLGLYSSWTRKNAPSLYRLEAEYFLRG